MLLHTLSEDKALNMPKWMPDNTIYLTMMGSEAYAVSSGSSDIDIYGVVIPPKGDVFPHLNGYIHGFGAAPSTFSSYQQHHIKRHPKEYDLTIYSIVKYFDLLMNCNPTVIDSLFVPRRCILHTTAISEHLRECRRIFLTQNCRAKFMGFAYSQMHKIDNKTAHDNPKRHADIQTHGYDTKYAYHLVRLVLECQQILLTGDLDIEQDREVLKSIRRGEWTLTRLKEWFESAEKRIITAQESTKIPAKPDEVAIKRLLLECLEMHYGSIDNAVSLDVDIDQLKAELMQVLERY